MTCKKCKSNISAMLDGCLDSEVCRQVESHIASCDACKKYHETLLTMRDALSSSEQLTLPEGFENRLHFALEREAGIPKKNPFLRHAPIIAAAAASMLLIAGAISFSQGFGMKSAKNAAESAPRAQEFSILSDAKETERSTDEYSGSAEPEAPMEGIMAAQELASEDMAAENGSVYVRNISQISITIGDDAAVVDSLNMLSAQNSGILNNATLKSEVDSSGEGNAISFDIPSGNYDSFINGLSSQYTLEYIDISTEDLSDEIYSLQQQEMYLSTSIMNLISLEKRTIEEENELAALQEELSQITVRLAELYALCSNVRVNIIINSKN